MQVDLSPPVYQLPVQALQGTYSVEVTSGAELCVRAPYARREIILRRYRKSCSRALRVYTL